MFQRAHQKQRTPDVGHAKRPEPALTTTVGKRTLTQEQTCDVPNLYARAIESARRELRAVHATALPTYSQTLRRNDLEPLAREVQLTHSALQIRHLLLTANQHVKVLEKAAPTDPIVGVLSQEVYTLRARAGKLGVYRGAEDMLPRGHVEEMRSPSEGAQRVRKPSAAQQRMQAVEKTSAAPIASAAPARLARGTAPPHFSLSRVAQGTVGY